MMLRQFWQYIIQTNHYLYYRMLNQPEQLQPQQTHSNIIQPPQDPIQQDKDQTEREESPSIDDIDILYDIYIKKTIQQTDITTHSEHYKIEVTNCKTNKKWTINRNYQDFLWLYTALKIALPGYILPYFPTSTVTKFLEQKLIYLNNKERAMYLVSELYQLQNFMTNLSRDQIFGFSQQLRIFLLQKNEDYVNGKRKIDALMQQLNIDYEENTGFRLSSLIDKGLNLFANKPSTQNIEFNKEWLEVKGKIHTYSTHLYSLIQKISMFKRTKEDEVFWKGPITEIDSIEKVIVKIQSSKPSTEILNAEFQVKLLHPLISECKKEVQLQELVRQKEDLQRLIKHLVQNEEDEIRIGKLLLRKQKFQTHFNQGWQKVSKEWALLAQDLSNRFQKIYLHYSRNMYKLWK